MIKESKIIKIIEEGDKLLLNMHAPVISDEMVRDHAGLIRAYRKYPIHCAAQRGHLKVVKFLSEESKDSLTNMADTEGRTPLMFAVESGNAKLVNYLLEKIPVRATINAEITGSGSNGETEDLHFTALHIAASRGHAEIVLALLKAGAAPEMEATGGLLPIHLAARAGRLDIMKIIADHIGLRKDYYRKCDKFGRSAVYFAAKHGHINLLKYLLEKDTTNLNEKVRDTKEAVGRADVYHTPLTVACVRGNLKVVQVLIDAGAQVTSEAVYHAILQNNLELVKLLINPDSTKISNDDHNGHEHTLLRLAVERDTPEMVEILLNKKLSMQNERQVTALHAACMKGSDAMVLSLLRKGNPNLRTLSQRANENPNEVKRVHCFDGYLHGLQPRTRELVELTEYVHNRTYENNYLTTFLCMSFGYSKDQKIAAANALIKFKEDGTELTREHKAVLSTGRLGAIYQRYNRRG